MADMDKTPTLRSLLASDAGDHTVNDDSAVARTRLQGPGVAVVTFGGENDGAADAYIYRCVGEGNALIHDLSDVGYLGVQGIQALLSLAEECARAAWHASRLSATH